MHFLYYIITQVHCGIETAVLNPEFQDGPLWTSGFDGHQQEYFMFSRFLKPLASAQSAKLVEFNKRLDDLNSRFQAPRGFVELLKKAVDPELRFPTGLFRRRLDLRRDLEKFGGRLLKTQTKAFEKLTKQYDEVLNGVDTAESASLSKFSRTEEQASKYINSKLSNLASLTKQTTAAIISTFNHLNKTSSKSRDLANKYLNTSSNTFSKHLNKELKQVRQAETATQEMARSNHDILTVMQEGTNNMRSKSLALASSYAANSLNKLVTSAQTMDTEYQSKLQNQAKSFNKDLDLVANAFTRRTLEADASAQTTLKALNTSSEKQLDVFRKTADNTLTNNDRKLRALDGGTLAELTAVRATLEDGAEAIGKTESSARQQQSEISTNFREFSSLAQREAAQVQGDFQASLATPTWNSAVLQRAQAVTDAKTRGVEAGNFARTKIIRSGLDTDLDLAYDDNLTAGASEDVRNVLAAEAEVGRASTANLVGNSAGKMRNLRASREAAMADERRVVEELAANGNQKSAAISRDFRTLDAAQAAADSAAEMSDSRFAQTADRTRRAAIESGSQWGGLGERMEQVNENLPSFEGISDSVEAMRQYKVTANGELEGRLSDMRDSSDRSIAKFSGRATKVGATLKGKTSEVLDVIAETGERTERELADFMTSDTVSMTSDDGSRLASTAANKVKEAKLRERRLEGQVGNLEREYAGLGKASLGRATAEMAKMEEALEASQNNETLAVQYRLKKTSDDMLRSVEAEEKAKQQELESRKSRYGEIIEQVKQNVSDVEAWNRNLAQFKAGVQSRVQTVLDRTQREADLSSLNKSVSDTNRKFDVASEVVDENLREYDAVFNESETTVTNALHAKLGAFGQWLRGVVQNVDGYVNETGEAMRRGLEAGDQDENIETVVNKTKHHAEMTAAELEQKVTALRREAMSEAGELRGRIAEIEEAGGLWNAEMFEADEQVGNLKNSLADKMSSAVDVNANKINKKIRTSSRTNMQGDVGKLSSNVANGVGAVGGQMEAMRQSMALKQSEVDKLIAGHGGNAAEITGQQGEASMLTGEQLSALLAAIEAGMGEKVDAMAETEKVNGNRMASMRSTIAVFTNMVESALDEKTEELRLLSDSSRGLADDVDESVKFLAAMVETKVDDIAERAREIKKGLDMFLSRQTIEQTGHRDTLGKIKTTFDENKAKFDHESAVISEKFQDTARDGSRHRSDQLGRIDEWLRGEEASVNGIVAGLMRGASSFIDIDERGMSTNALIDDVSRRINLINQIPL